MFLKPFEHAHVSEPARGASAERQPHAWPIPGLLSVCRGPGRHHGGRVQQEAEDWKAARSKPPRAMYGMSARRAVGPATHEPAFRGRSAAQPPGTHPTILSGPPLPPSIFIGSATIPAPVAGSRSRFVRFSKPTMLSLYRITWER